ncbi:hypothetical protein CSOJ01_01673 [Colletotrichum sojae]|uniref:Uncharacterized protein n=1 Tax=Colletotrichum sojae TaxID=2175907 RepID=A0A8H6N439_9PEZI|nr:hypothetical protein CSOJ01_01673 [Colletotrichum sojae]
MGGEDGGTADQWIAGGATSDRFAARGSRLLPATERTTVDDLARVAVRDWDPVCDGDRSQLRVDGAGYARIAGRQTRCYGKRKRYTSDGQLHEAEITAAEC